jgi:hypothetical protein
MKSSPNPTTTWVRARIAALASMVVKPKRNCRLNKTGRSAGNVTNPTSSGMPTRWGIDRICGPGPR